jgi:TPR repeat protein
MWTAAQVGDARAQALMAFLYIAGDGVPKSLPDAEAWARKSAAQGDAFGQIILGGMYQSNEISGPANPEEKKARIAEGNEQLTRLEREQGIPAPARVIDGNAAGREGMAILLMGVVKAVADITKEDPHEQEEIE